MQKKIKVYIKLIKRLINLNLLLTSPLYDMSNKFSLAKLNLIFINPFDYIKMVKEFIRSLQFLRYAYRPLLYLEIDATKFEYFVAKLQENTKKASKIKYLDINRKKKNLRIQLSISI